MEIHNYTFLNLSNNNLFNNQKCNTDVPQTPISLTFDQQEQDMMSYQPKKYFRMNSLEYLSIISELPNTLLSDSMTNLFNNMTKATPTSNSTPAPACANAKTSVSAPTNSQEDPLEVAHITPFSFSFTNLAANTNGTPAPAANNGFLFVNNANNHHNTTNNNAFVSVDSIPAFNAATIIANSLNFAHLAGANIPFVNNICNNNNNSSSTSTAVPPPPSDEFNVETFLSGVDAAVKPEPPATRPKMEK
jgi:hypothetical protein